MNHRSMRELLAPILPASIAAALLLAYLPPSAAAAGPATQCWGSLSSAPTANDPHALNYQFDCDWGITAYSILATRQPSDYSTIDDFDPDGLAYVQSTGNPAPGVDFDCAGLLPGNGINCGLSSGYAPAPDFIEGWIDTSEPYCAYTPRGATKAVPEVIVQLIVTDTNGVEDGPFRLGLQPACKPVPKPKKKTKAQSKHK